MTCPACFCAIDDATGRCCNPNCGRVFAHRDIKPQNVLASTEGAQRKREAIQRVASASSEWVAMAIDVAIGVAEANREFTTDDVWDAITKQGGIGAPPEPRAMGAVIQALRRQGTIKPTERYVQSRRPDCHSRPIPVWIANRG